MSTGPGLESLVNQTISIITNDGRIIVGTLRGFDQATNIILDESHERVYSTRVSYSLYSTVILFFFLPISTFNPLCLFLLSIILQEGVQQLALGLYIIRGDNISVVGELDEELDLVNDLSKIKAHPLKPVIH
ncbi:sm-like protein LSM8 isoform X1 [Zingiber officinale]|uniref:sm-like protein LSM8 isoform X1 n=1 Tax=Zingiber officinale TaxID=94328 RepID=UPI001C4CFA2B|nr:sm-like protein LSM8 isoform X1 [Zingiber officinale]